MTELAQMCLLIIGDDVAGRELLTHSLAQAGYRHIVSTGDPTRAHELCVTEHPDLVLFDLDMPGLSLQALSKIAREPARARAHRRRFARCPPAGPRHGRP
jgi:CheY-like chemotaxis protein